MKTNNILLANLYILVILYILIWKYLYLTNSGDSNFWFLILSEGTTFEHAITGIKTYPI